MNVVLPTLLCLGLYLYQRTQAQKRNLPRPQIQAIPGSMIPYKKSVIIQCRGPAEAKSYRIWTVGSSEPLNKKKQLGSRTMNTLNITEMMPDRAGLYHCSYQRGDRWSEHSDPLQLMMTGAYDKPSLSSIPGTDGASRDKVKLQCFSKVPFNTYILTKEDGSHIIKNQSSTPQDKVHRAVFLMDHVSSTQAGTYRCFGVMSNNPYVWSHPSDPLELEVNEVRGHPMESSPSTAPPDNQSLQKDILIGIPVAAVLILTLVLLFFIFHHCKAKNILETGKSKIKGPGDSVLGVDRKERQPEAGPMDGQACEALGPKEVTYSELICSALTQGTAMTPSSLPSHTQTSEYATLAPR